MIFKKLSVLLIALLGIATSALAQIVTPNDPPTSTDGRRGNTITTAVPFLLISPDARSGSMGDVGAAIAPDVNATHWNPAK